RRGGGGKRAGRHTGAARGVVRDPGCVPAEPSRSAGRRHGSTARPGGEQHRATGQRTAGRRRRGLGAGWEWPAAGAGGGGGAEVCARATGGVLFIDEAYALTGDQYAQEAVNTLVKEMEDHREDLVVIVAGYPDPMVGFIAQNPGLASRFTTTIEFDDYSDQEL